MATMLEVAATRNNEPKDRAILFLEWVLTWHVVLIGMLADSSDELMVLVRLFDEHFFDAAHLESCIIEVIRRLHVLFIDGRCASSGYTKLAMDTLATPRSFMVRGVMRTRGGPGDSPQAAFAFCLGLMQSWLKLFHVSLEAEFGLHQINMAFSPFKIDPKAGPINEDSKALRRLSQTCRVSHSKFVEQFADRRKMAIRNYTESATKTTSYECWRRSHISAQGRCRDKRESVEFEAVFGLYGAFCGCSTGNNERDFSVAKHLVGPQRARLRESGENDELVLHYTDPNEDEVLVKGAIRIWTTCFGAARASGLARRGSNFVGGLCRLTKKRKTEAQFLATRRSEVAGMLEASPSTCSRNELASHATGGAGWHERHDELEGKIRFVSR